MRLRVRTKQGTNAIDDVEPSSLVSDLKRRLYCTGRVDVPPEEQRLYFNGTLASSERKVGSLGMTDGCVVVVLQGRKKEEAIRSKEEYLTPSREEIRKVTAAEARAHGNPRDEISRYLQPIRFRDDSFEIEDELQLHRLVDAALGIGIRSGLPSEEEEVSDGDGGELHVNEHNIERLQDMGFPEDMVRRALLIHNGNMVEAMEWMLEHRDDPEAGTPVEDEETSRLGRRRGRLELAQIFPLGDQPVEPDQAILERLVEMGFEEQRVAAALRFTRNDEDAACALLLGDFGEVMQVDVTRHIPIPTSRQDTGRNPLQEHRQNRTGIGQGSRPVPAHSEGLLDEIELQEHAEASAAPSSQGMVDEPPQEQEEQEQLLDQHDILDLSSQENTRDDAQLLRLLQSQRVMDALQAIALDPSRTLEYAQDPEIGPVIVHLHALLQTSRTSDPGI